MGDYFEPAPCRHCGEEVPVFTFLVNERTKTRYVCKAEHSCSAGAGARRERQKAGIAAWQRSVALPTPQVIDHTRLILHLPQRYCPGLAQARRTEGNQPAYQAAVEMVRRFQKGERARGLYLWGKSGAGKTYLGTALIYDLYHRTGAAVPPGAELPAAYYGPKACARWWDMADLYREMGRHMDGHRGDYDDELLLTCDCLLLDDLGKEYPSDWRLATWFVIVNGRYNERKATVFTSNYHPSEQSARMVEAIGEHVDIEVKSIFARICEMCEIVEMTGPDWRAEA